MPISNQDRQRALRVRRTQQQQQEVHLEDAARHQRRRGHLPAEQQEDLRGRNRAQHRSRRAAMGEARLLQLWQVEAARLRNHRRQLLSTENRPRFWENIPQLRLPPYTVSWRDPCPHCGAILLETESPTFCCNHGHLAVRPLSPYPDPIALRIQGDSGRFRDMSRRLNRLFMLSVIGSTGGMGLFGVAGDGSSSHVGPPAVTLTGRTYHRILPSSEAGHPIHWMLYDEQDRRARNEHNYHIPDAVVDEFRSALIASNPIYRRLEQYRVEPDQPSKVLEIWDHPGTNEVAAVIHTANLLNIDPRHFYVYDRDHQEQPKQVSILSPLYEPLSYPILFFNGDIGWSPSYRSTTGHKLTMMQYYKSRLLVDKERLASFSRLAAEYSVDAFSRVADQRLEYIQHSKELEHREQREWEEERLNLGDDDSDGPTHSIELPASYLGSKRWCAAQVADTIALAKNGRTPTFMITATTNPNWPEIVARRRTGHAVNDKPSVICRAFKARLNKLIRHIKTHFGKMVYIVRVNEFQKRGLPHAHIVDPQVRLDDIDSIISAELPLPRVDDELRDLVLKHMMHPQDHLNPGRYSRCNRDGQCQYHYPHPIRLRTTLDEFGRPLYRRRKPDDAWVVPYNPALLRFWQGHINVEIVSTSDVLVYLYKYLHKGPDTALVSTTENQDSQDKANEIEDHVKCRYISNIEATWRLMGLNITRKEPGVIRLPVHLPNQNRHQYIQKNRECSDISALMHYFARPPGPPFNGLTYIEYFENYRLLPSQASAHPDDYHESIISNTTPPKVIRKRSQNHPVARIQTVPPSAGEVFYLRALLNHIPSYSWDNLKTINGISYSTFAEAAAAFGLFHDINEAETAMHEAIANLADGPQLRFLFSVLIQEEANGPHLWEHFKHNMAADHFRHGLDEELALDQTLRDIASILRTNSRTLDEFGLPVPIEINFSAVQAELSAFVCFRTHLREKASSQYAMMTNCQRKHYDALYDVFSTKDNGVHSFLEGKAGRGKSFVTTTLTHQLRGQGQIVLIAGSTAKSIQGYARGQTMHNLFHLPVTDNSSNVHSRLLSNLHHPDAILIQNASLIILEELPMANITTLEAIDELLRALMNCNRPFGGKNILGIGDFRQVAPVVPGAYGEEPILEASVKSSFLWKYFRIFSLNDPIRNAADPDFSTFIDTIGEGWNLPSVDLARYTKGQSSLDDAIDFLYPPDILSNPLRCIDRAFLSPTNILVDDFNDRVLQRIPSDFCHYFSRDSIKERHYANADQADIDFLAHLNERGVPPHTLNLKVGAICVLMRNLNVSKGLVKNARVHVLELHSRVIKVSLFRENFDPSSSQKLIEEQHFIPRISFNWKPGTFPFTVLRKQFPLRLAYATTFNSCQGLTLDTAIIDLRVEVFAHGQLYTALSRVRHRADLQTLTIGETADQTCRNIVYKSLLLL